MQSKQTGFTLIELIIVIVILGALAAVALPRFIDLQQDADDAALEGVAGAMSSAMAVNFAGCSVARHDDGNANCVAVSQCEEVDSILQTGTPTNYTVTPGAIGDGSTNGDSSDCTVTRDGGDSRTFVGIVAGQ